MLPCALHTIPAAVIAYRLVDTTEGGATARLPPEAGIPTQGGVRQLLFPTAALPPGRVHRLAVFASNGAGEGPASPVYTFTLPGG